MAKTRQKKRTPDDDRPDFDGPERLCAVTRAELSPDDLIRFVRGPDGEIVPDLEQVLPGRGIWLTCDRKIVEKAILTRTFGKSLKTDVRVPEGLAERIDMMLARRAGNTLALANKAGLVVTGFEKIDSALEKGGIVVVLHGSDAADDGRQKLDRKFKAIQRDRSAKAPIVDVLTIAQLSLAIGRPSVVHAALLPGGLVKRFQREAERVSRYRSVSASEQALGDARDEVETDARNEG